MLKRNKKKKYIILLIFYLFRKWTSKKKLHPFSNFVIDYNLSLTKNMFQLYKCECIEVVLIVIFLFICKNLRYILFYKILHFIAQNKDCRCSIVVSISACHADDPGSIPGNGGFWNFYNFMIFVFTNKLVYLISSIEACRCSKVVGIFACHADDPGSIPGNGILCGFYNFMFFSLFFFCIILYF